MKENVYESEGRRFESCRARFLLSQSYKDFNVARRSLVSLPTVVPLLRRLLRLFPSLFGLLLRLLLSLFGIFFLLRRFFRVLDPLLGLLFLLFSSLALRPLVLCSGNDRNHNWFLW